MHTVSIKEGVQKLVWDEPLICKMKLIDVEEERVSKQDSYKIKQDLVSQSNSVEDFYLF